MTINTQLIDLPYTMRAFSTPNIDGSYTIVLNSRLSCEMLKESYVHEIEHIEGGDFYKEEADVIEYYSHKGVK